MPGLTEIAMTAAAWSYASVAARIVVQFAAGIALARMLGSAPFGMVAAVWALVGVGSQFVDAGFGSALVQKAEITAEDIRFVFTLQMSLGIALTAALALAAPPLARLLGNPALAPLIRLLSWALVLQAAGQTANSLLRRKLDFKTAQLAQLAGSVIGFGLVAIPMAVSGCGVLSLAAGQLAQLFSSAVIAYAAVRHPVAPLLYPQSRSLAGMGARVASTNLVNWAISGLDSVMMSRYFGPVTTGLFNRAQTLALVPAGSLVQVAQNVLFPAYSRRGDDPAVTKRVFLAALGAVATVLLPVAAVLAVAGRTIVVGLYGPAWSGVAGLMTPLAMAMPAQAAMSLAGPLLWARNRVGQELAIQLATLALFAIALAVAVRSSAMAVVWTVFAVYLARSAAMLRQALRAARAGWLDCARVARGAAAVAAAAALTAALLDRLLDDVPSAPLKLGLLALGTFALTVAGLARFAPYVLPAETLKLLRDVQAAYRLRKLRPACVEAP